LFLPSSKVHWFGDVGYRHNPWTHCPVDDESHFSGRCLCSRNDNFDEDVYSQVREANGRDIRVCPSGGRLRGNKTLTSCTVEYLNVAYSVGEWHVYGIYRLPSTLLPRPPYS
jgi:hypothetical protein